MQTCFCVQTVSAVKYLQLERSGQRILLDSIYPLSKQAPGDGLHMPPEY